MRRLDSFQRLALGTTIVAFLLIGVGALVRATGAGMGCPDWPKCFGLWIPPLRAGDLPAGFDASLFNAAKTWTEYLNRLLGVLTGFLIFATLVAAIRRHRSNSHVLWPAAMAFLGVGFEGWLGGRVVAHGLAPWIVTAHLLVALAIAGLLVYGTAHAFGPVTSADRTLPAIARARRAAVVVTAVALVQIALGTQVRGRIEPRLLQDPTARLQALEAAGSWDAVHRASALAVVALCAWLWLRIQRTPEARHPLRRASTAAVAIAGAQLVVGGALTQFGLPAAAQVLHVVVASVLFGALWLCVVLAR